MSRTTTTRPTKFVLSALVGLSAGAGVGLAMAGTYEDKPLWLIVLAYAFTVGPVLACGFYLLVLDRQTMEAAQGAAEHNIETAWAQRAGYAAWAATVAILIAINFVGQASGISWLEELGSAHVAIVGLGSFAVSYLLIKRRES